MAGPLVLLVSGYRARLGDWDGELFAEDRPDLPDAVQAGVLAALALAVQYLLAVEIDLEAALSYRGQGDAHFRAKLTPKFGRDPRGLWVIPSRDAVFDLQLCLGLCRHSNPPNARLSDDTCPAYPSRSLLSNSRFAALDVPSLQAFAGPEGVANSSGFDARVARAPYNATHRAQPCNRGSSSVGRAPAFQAGCRGFESRLPLQIETAPRGIRSRNVWPPPAKLRRELVGAPAPVLDSRGARDCVLLEHPGQGPVAQWQSGRLITAWSQVRTLAGPPLRRNGKKFVSQNR